MKSNRTLILVALLGACVLSSGCAIIGIIPIAATIGVGVATQTGEEDEYEAPHTFPVVSGILPSQGPQAGGTSIQVLGLRFQTGATVTIGGNSATNVVFISAAELTCDTPAGTPGPVDVVVTNPDAQSGTLGGGFIFLGPSLTVTGINPTSGPTAGGTTITVSGTNFQTNAVVAIGGTPCTNHVFAGVPTTIVCDTPAGSAGAALVRVANPDTQWADSPTNFTYQTGADSTPPNAITDLAAAQGSADGTVDLTWTAPGDDGTTGTASAYILKYSARPITAGNFNSARTYTQSWTPASGGTGESKTLTGLTPGIRYFFALKAEDEVPNTSSISNVPWGLAACSTLLAYWPLEDGSGGTATDISGNNNHGTLNGCTWTTAGVVGNALQFNGSSDYVDTGLIFATPAGGGFTISAWFKTPNAGATTIGIMGQWGSAAVPTYDGRSIHMNSSGVVYWVAQGNAGPSQYASTSSAPIYNDNVIHHVCGTCDGTNLYLYIDGALIATAPFTWAIQNPARTPLIGAINDAGGGGIIHGYFDGMIDEVKIFTSYRTVDQIREEYFSREVSLTFQQTYDAHGGGFDLTWDGNNLWEADHNGGGNIYKLDASVSVIQTVNDPGGNCHGLTWDGTDFWKVDRDSHMVYQFDTAGSTITSFAIPTSDTRGITWDGTDLWITDLTAKQLHRMSPTGTILNTYDVDIGGTFRPLSLTWDGASFWIAYPSSVGGGGSRIVRIRNDGSILQIIDPGLGDAGVGITWDGANIWFARQVGPPGKIHKLKRE